MLQPTRKVGKTSQIAQDVGLVNADIIEPHISVQRLRVIELAASSYWGIQLSVLISIDSGTSPFQDIHERTPSHVHRPRCGRTPVSGKMPYVGLVITLHRWIIKSRLRHRQQTKERKLNLHDVNSNAMSLGDGLARPALKM